MPIIRYGEPLNVLVAAKGHPYQRDAFMAMFDEMDGVSGSLVEQPAAGRLMNPESLSGIDALVLYDMPGLDFRAPDGPRFVAPEPAIQEGFLRLLESGMGIVALHHAIAGWPAWPEYADLLGGRFLYKPGVLRGAPRQDSGYRHEVTHTVSVVGEHPVTQGVPRSFSLTDEVYLFETFEDDVTHLLRSDYGFTRDNFYSASQAVAGKLYSNEGWSHPDGSNLVGWVKRARNSPLVYLQFGDGPETYAHPVFRQLVRNAIHWVASPDARA
ncbi:MAG: ThuA domain-containing protein [Alphaproteobacteria bacterium]|nr:ThuA domain-containing protein [Alphaproteobacteria bacterium]